MDNNNKTTGASVGIGFTGLLTIAFIVLKLTGVINWSWVWIFSPIWIPAGIAALIASIILVVYLCHFLMNKKWKYGESKSAGVSAKEVYRDGRAAR